MTVSTFNLLCPAYRRMSEDDTVREADFPAEYTARNRKILELPLWSSSDIICCQEFWYNNADIFDLYVKALSGRYRLHGLQRIGPRGTRRPDGLFMAISREWEVVHEADIDFEDAASRCAQLLHLVRPGASAATSHGVAPGAGGSADDRANGAPTELLVANVHLLFPHNEAAARIRVREVHKLLSYLDAYKRSLSRPPPALICGDFNGEEASTVVQFLKRYGWQSSYALRNTPAGPAAAAAALGRLPPPPSPPVPAPSAAPSAGWVSHFTHEQATVGVDYIWMLNPSQSRLPVPEWTDCAPLLARATPATLPPPLPHTPPDTAVLLSRCPVPLPLSRAPLPVVFSEMAQQLARQGFSRPADAWLYFHRLANSSSSKSANHGPTEASNATRDSDADVSRATLLDAAADVAFQVPLDAAGFRRALRQLDLERGDALGTLTEAEVQMLISSCDRDGDNRARRRPPTPTHTLSTEPRPHPPLMHATCTCCLIYNI